MGDDLRLHWLFSAGAALSHQIIPLPHAGLSILQEGPILSPLDVRQKFPQCSSAVADQPDFDGVAQTDAFWVDLDLHRTGVTRLWVKLDVGKTAADDQQGVATLQRLLRRFGSEQADPAGAERTVVRNGAFAEQRLDHRRPEAVGNRQYVFARVERATAGQYRGLFSGIEDFG